jgi:hypothetical protein
MVSLLSANGSSDDCPYPTAFSDGNEILSFRVGYSVDNTSFVLFRIILPPYPETTLPSRRTSSAS